MLPPRSSQLLLLVVRETQTLKGPVRESLSPGSAGKRNGTEGPGTGEWLDGSTRQGHFFACAMIQIKKKDQLWQYDVLCQNSMLYLWELCDSSTSIVIGHYASP